MEDLEQAKKNSKEGFYTSLLFGLDPLGAIYSNITDQVTVGGLGVRGVEPDPRNIFELDKNSKDYKVYRIMGMGMACALQVITWGMPQIGSIIANFKFHKELKEGNKETFAKFMPKSKERTDLENKIRKACKDTWDTGMQIIQEKFSGDAKAAMKDKSFQKKTNNLLKNYLKGHDELESLERKEQYPAMFAYANQLDFIAEHIPKRNRKFCYNPFSGVDFYWARIFDKTVFRDIAFDDDEHPKRWWGAETYSIGTREWILNTLKKLKIISHKADMKFVSGDANKKQEDNHFNNYETTLLVKGDYNVIEYLNKAFKDDRLRYGAIIVVNPANPLEEITDKLAKEGYKKKKSLKGIDTLAPYTMDLKNIHMFIKKPIE